MGIAYPFQCKYHKSPPHSRQLHQTNQLKPNEGGRDGGRRMDYLDNARVAEVQRRGVDAAALRPNYLTAEGSRKQ